MASCLEGKRVPLLRQRILLHCETRDLSHEQHLLCFSNISFMLLIYYIFSSNILSVLPYIGKL